MGIKSTQHNGVYVGTSACYNVVEDRIEPKVNDFIRGAGNTFPVGLLAFPIHFLMFSETLVLFSKTNINLTSRVESFSRHDPKNKV